MKVIYMSEFDKFIKKEEPKAIIEERKPLFEKHDTPIANVEQPKQETKPTQDEATLTKEDKKKLLDKFIHSGSFKKKEIKLKELYEIDPMKTKQTTVLILAAIGAMFVFGSYMYIKEAWVLILMMVLGSCMFLPIGMIIGWAFLDSYMRTRIFRRLTHKNYGIINFIGKGNKMVSKMKNFDNDLIWIKEKCWLIRKGRIVLLNKNGNAINDGKEIDPQSIVTMMDTIPVMFVDLDSIEPLAFNREPREQINPIELAANINSYIDNQLAKIMFLKKTMDIYFIIMIVCSVAAIGISYMNMSTINDMNGKIDALKSQVDILINQLSPSPPVI